MVAYVIIEHARVCTCTRIWRHHGPRAGPVTLKHDGTQTMTSPAAARRRHRRGVAAIEVLLYPDLYDSAGVNFYAPYAADERLILPDYTVS